MKLIDTPKCLLVGNLPEGAIIQGLAVMSSAGDYRDKAYALKIRVGGTFHYTQLPPGSYGQPILASEMEDKQLDDLLEVWLSIIERISGKSMLEFHNLQPSTTVVIPKK